MKTRLTISDLEKQQAAGKIRSFSVEHKKPARTAPAGATPKGRTVAKHFKKKSAGLEWMSWNLLYWCNTHSLLLQEEYRFDDKRMWRFDWAIESLKVAIEFEGGIYLENSGHKTAKHYTKDTNKYNRAAQLGWKVLRYTAMNYKDVLKDLENLIK